MESPDEITQAELGQFLALTRALFLHLEDGYYQHEEGLLNDNAFETVREGAHGLARFLGFRVAWKAVRFGYGGGFLTFMDGVVARASLESPAHVQSVDEWRVAFAAEAAGGAR